MRITIFILCISVIAILSGCSRGTEPVLPGNAPCIPLAYNSLPAGVTDYFTNGTPSAGMGALGLFQLEINPSDKSAELISLRQSALTDVLEVVDITNFLKLAPCYDCAKISSVALDSDGNIVVSIGIKHPFGVGDPFKPITGKNRGDLHVFNVEGIVISNTPGTSFMGLGEAIAGFELVNADGYTGYLDNVIDAIYETDATIHPYKMHFDDYSEGNFNASYPTGFESVTDPMPSGNLVMAMGCDYDYQDYIFSLDDDSEFDFIFAVGCTYAVSSANKHQRFSPEYRVPQHNKKAASEVYVEITRNEMAAGMITSDADLEISVLDINHDVETGTNLDQMLEDSSVGGITIDIPQVLSSPFEASIIPIGGNGRDPANPLVFAATITNEAGADIGIYPGLVKVTDAYPVGQNTSPLLGSMDGIERVGPIENPLNGLFAIDEFATYTTFEISVETSNLPPLVELLSECETVYSGGWTVLSVGPGTMDQDGNNLVLYEFDFDYDGVTFDVDATNTTGESVTTNPYINDTADPVIITCALRVTDDGIPPASGIGTVEIEIAPVNTYGKNMPLRPGEGVSAIDLGINETTGEIIVGFDDRQIWKYEPDYSSGAYFCEVDVGCAIVHLDIAANGHSLARSDTRAPYTGGRSFCYDPSGAYTWRGSQGITYTSGVTELDGSWILRGRPAQNNLLILTNWPVVGDIRWFQETYVNYNGYSGTFTSNFEGQGGFDSELTIGFDVRSSNGWFWTLEGAPRYELELFSFSFNYQNVTIGQDGGQVDTIDGFNDPRDIVVDADDRVYVLDVLSTGINCIKLYDMSGVPIAIFGTCGEIGGDPIAIESDEGDGEIHVLHSNGVSVFYPSEIP